MLSVGVVDRRIRRILAACLVVVAGCGDAAAAAPPPFHKIEFSARAPSGGQTLSGQFRMTYESHGNPKVAVTDLVLDTPDVRLEVAVESPAGIVVRFGTGSFDRFSLIFEVDKATAALRFRSGEHCPLGGPVMPMDAIVTVTSVERSPFVTAIELPVPATIVLLVTGLLTVALVVRNRRGAPRSVAAWPSRQESAGLARIRIGAPSRKASTASRAPS